MSYLVVEENRRPIGFSCAECLHNGMGSVECYGCPLGLAGLGEDYSSWIVAAFQQFLGRNPNPTEITNWTAIIVEQHLTQAQLNTALQNSPEGQEWYYRPWILPGFQTYLGRNPNPTEITNWTKVIVEQHLTQAQLNAALQHSPEGEAFYYRPWIVTAFPEFLGRDPNPTEILNWAAVIVNQSLTQEQFRAALQGSPEAKAYVAAKEAAAAEAARKAAEEATKGTGTTTAGLANFLKSPWIWVAAAAAGGFYYWTQVKHRSMGQIPYVGQYLGGKRRGRK